MKKTVKIILLDAIDILVGLAVFAGMFWLFLMMATGRAEAVEPSITFEDGRRVDVPVIMSDALYVDSRGAQAYGWELTEGMRLMMLECGSKEVPEEDKREHCAVLFKQLLYTQTVGGYNGWGTTLWGVMHAGNTYTETAPRIWNDEAEPTDEIAAIFWDVWQNGYSSDFRVQNYRLGWYFDGDWSTPAYSIGTTFYSVNVWQDFSMFELDENSILRY